jgi:hypothetical protein
MNCKIFIARVGGIYVNISMGIGGGDTGRALAYRPDLVSNWTAKNVVVEEKSEKTQT